MAPPSEDELAADLAAAVAKHADYKLGQEPFPEGIEEALDSLLYREGSDGVVDLTIAERTPTGVTILGLVIWVTDQTLGPLEATFTFDEGGGSVNALTVRAGDDRIAQRDAPPYSSSARVLQRIIATRPTADEDWTCVIRHEFG